MEPRVLVIGPGALGVLIAARLAAAEVDVHVAARPDSKTAYPREFRVTGEKGRVVTGPVPVVRLPKELRHEVDVLVLATKCDDAEEALRRWLPSLKQHGAVVALQNGIMGDTMAKIAADRLVECTVAFPATLDGPGISTQTGPGTFILGPWPDARMASATPLQLAAEVMAIAETTRVSDNMAGIKWTKLLINSAITGLGAITGVELGALFGDKRGRAAALAIVAEGMRAGEAAGIRFEKVAGFWPGLVVSSRGPRRQGDVVMRIFGRRYRRQRSSSLQSIERGRRTEVHHLNGRIVQEAHAHGLQAPVNAAVLALAGAIEAGQVAPSLDHLAGLLPA